MKRLFVIIFALLAVGLIAADGLLQNTSGTTTVGGTSSATTMNVGTLVVTNQIYGDVILTNTHSKYFHIYNEFTGGTAASSLMITFGGNSFFNINTDDQQHFGQMLLGTSSNTTNGIHDELDAYMLGGGPTTFETCVKYTVLGTGGTLWTSDIGCGSSEIGSDFANGVWFRYASDMNSGNWICMSSNGGTVSSNNTSVAVTTGWTRLTWSWAPSSPITYYINGTPCFTNSSANIPTNNTYGMIWRATERSNSGTARLTYVDYLDYTCLFTTPR